MGVKQPFLAILLSMTRQPKCQAGAAMTRKLLKKCFEIAQLFGYLLLRHIYPKVMYIITCCLIGLYLLFVARKEKIKEEKLPGRPHSDTYFRNRL